MGDIACRGENTSQYLLVTPKLLPGLRYDERMEVHVIASGRFMPSALGHGDDSDGGLEDGEGPGRRERNKWDFARFVSVQERLNGLDRA